ncbi:MAG: hypothetical protein ACRCUE_17195 [Bosea sp. (in: a-proteobacteria)]
MSQDAAEQGQVAAPIKQKLSWGEKRDRRRKRRKVFEEVLGWILVPALIYVAYLIFNAVGGIPKELSEFAAEVFATVTGGRL